MKINSLLQRLQENDYKLTQARKDICDSIKKTKKIFSVQQISKYIPHVDTASVYRTFEILEKINIITPVTRIDGEQFYEKYDEKDHHHHIICKKCKKAKCVDCKLHIPNIPGFNNITHSTILTGLCNKCI
ncbi:hypothetical protein HOF40_00805 [Candidatus Parcubacteria bacterium]|jgi:Fe2+ or Zn2+ uptake regulation protein|nr:hypothetical protein [Candidatus Parcubacteria bacterium]MBT3948610.1 hypothetical protein [Candidatus Parcubacteria bacterium]